MEKRNFRSVMRLSALAPVTRPWLTVTEAAQRAGVGRKTIYREIKAGRLKASRIGGRRELRMRPEWVDQWLEKEATREGQYEQSSEKVA